DKDGKTIVLYTHSETEHHAYLENAKERGYDVVIMDSPLSSHLLNKLEQQNANVTFKRIDADTLDKLIAKEEAQVSKLSKEDEEKLKPVITSQVETGKFTVVFESLSEKEKPMLITQSEFMRRMKEMQATGGGGMSMFGSMPENYNLVVNSNHPLISKILEEKDESVQKTLAKQAADLALLSQGLLKGKDLTEFINRSVDLIK
ncbi:MAG: molecular chaperone HtpG, partial [Flavobacteriales bacterium]